jgi:phosphate:Na+ symporter
MEFDLWRPLAGLGLFLFSMSVIENALEAVSGRSFRRFLRRNTDHPIKGILSGTLATAVLQSSSLVGLMMLALVGAGVVRMRNALSVIFGANLGTTMTGWIVATIGFKLQLDALSYPLIALGGLAAILVNDGGLRQSARIVFALGLLLMGLELMKGAVGDVGQIINLGDLQEFNAFQFLLFGIVFSALVQSSSATMMVTLSALHGGVIELSAAAAVVIGADLGTTVTLILGALKGSAAKKRVATGHFLFNLASDIIAFGIRGPLLAAIALLGLSDVLALAAFHSAFNLFGIALFTPFIGRFADWLEHRFEDEDTSVNHHLAAEALGVPEAAVEAIQLETNHLLGRVICQNLRIPEPPLNLPPGDLPVGLQTATAIASELGRSFRDAYDATKRLEGETIRFVTQAQVASLQQDQSDAISQCQLIVREAIHASKSLKDVHADLRTFAFSQRAVLNEYSNQVRNILAEFYARIFELPNSNHVGHALKPSTGNLEDIILLGQLAHQRHDELHASIYQDVRATRLDAGDVSSLLNVNRELLNSNRALLLAIATATLPHGQVETLELLPASVV